MDGRDRAIQRIGMLRASIRAQEEEVKDLIASLGGLEVGKSVHGEWILDVQPNKRFDASTAKKNLSPAQLKKVSVMTPNSALAKAVLGDDYALCQKDYGTKISVYIPEEDD